MAQEVKTNGGSSLDRDDFQTETCVLVFNHIKEAESALDPHVQGNGPHKRYYHIITPIKQKSRTMYRFQIKGYAYGIAKPLDIIFCGYPYIDGKIHQSCAIDLHKLGFKMDQYILVMQ